MPNHDMMSTRNFFSLYCKWLSYRKLSVYYYFLFKGLNFMYFIFRCKCGFCQDTQAPQERLCCRDVQPTIITSLMAPRIEKSKVQCITQTRGFDGNCLNIDVIEASMLEYVHHNGRFGDEEPMNE